MARRHSRSKKKTSTRKKPRMQCRGIIELTPRGFGFVKTAEGEFFIPSSKTRGAFPGDLVEVAPLQSKTDSQKGLQGVSRRKEARVTQVVMRSHESIIGRFEKADPFGVVIPSDPCIQHDIFTLLKDAPHVKDGDVVEAEILSYPTRKSPATGKVMGVIGHEGSASLMIDMLVAQAKIATSFSDAALLEATQCKQEVSRSLARGYEDLRMRFVFTVDPFDARDFDDALSIEKTNEGFKLGVYIADVSRYVPFGSSLDLDARQRATSVYLVDRVVPMLPERLSNDLCSLKPGCEREVLAVESTLASDGKVTQFRIFPAIICSKARLSYEQAQYLIDHNEEQTVYNQFSQLPFPHEATMINEETLTVLQVSMRHLSKLAQSLFNQRLAAGCMDFNRIEVKVDLDENKEPYGVHYRYRTPATRMVEESMILANRLVAQWLSDHRREAIFRVHDAPDTDRLAQLYTILHEFKEFNDLNATQFCVGDPHVLQQVLRLAHELPQGELVDMLMLRSMKRARYATTQASHFGLALDYYCHFTSPIRRYPDLVVHRLVKENLFGNTESTTAQNNALPWIAEHSSKMERVAAKLEHETQMAKLVELMQQDIGHEFDAVISGISTFGVTLRLHNTASGFLDIQELGDEYFSYDPYRFALTGSSSGKVYRLGSRISVVLVQVKLSERQLIFKRKRKNE